MKFLLQSTDSYEDFTRVLQQALKVGPVEVSVRRLGQRPSTQQRNLMHQWFEDIASTLRARTGKPFDKEYVKEVMKFRFGAVDDFGELLSTERYTPEQRNQFMACLENYAADQSIRLTAVPPDDTYQQYREAHL